MPGLPLPPVDDLLAFYTKSTSRKSIQMYLDLAVKRNSIANCVNNGSGLIRVSTIANHNLITNDFIIIEGVLGCVEANGFWKVTRIDDVTVDLIGSAFVNAMASSNAGIYDGLGYYIVGDASLPSNGFMCVSDAKYVLAGGSVNKMPGKPRKLTGTSEFYALYSDSGSYAMINALTVTNNTGGIASGYLKMRGTKVYGNVDEQLQKFTLPDKYRIVFGADFATWMYKDDGRPYTS